MLIKRYVSPIIKYDDEGKVIEPQRSPESKQYLLLMFFKESTQREKTFEIITGRQEVYDFIKENIEDLDIINSHILVEGVALEECANVYSFMKHMEQYFPDENFCIDDYREQDDEVQEDQPNNLGGGDEEVESQGQINNLQQDGGQDI